MSLCTSLKWDFVATNLDISLTQLYGSNIILNSNKFHLHSSGKRKGVIKNKTCAAVKITKKDVNTKHFSRVIFICIAYLLSSYTLLKTGMKSMS